MPPFGGFFIGLLAASVLNNAEAVVLLLHQMAPTDGLLDTGAEHGVIGKPQLAILQAQLSTYNLQAKWRDDAGPGAAIGVGGSAKVLGVVDAPSASVALMQCYNSSCSIKLCRC